MNFVRFNILRGIRILKPIGFVVLFLLLAYPLNVGATTDTVTLTTDVTESLSLGLSSGSLSLGTLTPGTPVRGSGGIVVTVSTSAANGYNLGISDAVSGNDSALLHTDTTTRITDTSALIAAPALWVNGTTKGLGVGVYAADTSKEAKWGSGTTYNHADNKYAGIPETATTIHSAPGFKAGADTTSISFVLDVENSQKTGAYSGNVTLTATAVLI